MLKIANRLFLLIFLFLSIFPLFSQTKVVDRSGQEVTVNSDASTSSKGYVQLSGDLNGTASSPTVVGIQGKPVDSTAPSAGQALLYDSVLGKWVPSSVVTGSNFYLVGTTTDAGSSKTGNLYRSGIIGSTSAGFGSYSNTTVVPTQGLAVSGKVGIGTNAPIAKLEVYSDVADAARFISSTTSTNYASFGLGNATGAYAKFLAGDSKLQLRNFTTNTLVYHADLVTGKLGIGTSSPSQRLHIAGQVEVDTLLSGAATDSLITSNSDGILRRLSFSNATKNLASVSATASGIVNNIAAQELGGVDKKINGVDVGKGAGSSNTNTRLGFSALANNTTGTNSVAVGFQTLFSQSVGISNVGIGTQALALLSSGSYNVGIGTYALKNQTTANNNTAVGYNSGLNITTGNQNVAIGTEALSDNTTSGNNVAVGAYSLDLTTGANNTALGFNTGKNNVGGAGNTFLGYRAGEVVTTGSNNVLVGANAGLTITSGGGNISIGNSNLISGSNNTIIGGTTSTLNIGAAYRSQIVALANGIGKIRLFADSLGLVGINTISPAAALDVPSTTSGILVPRMTTAQRTAITVSSNVESLLVYDTDVDMFYYYNLANTSWTPINVGTVKTQSASYTLTAADNGRVLDFTSATAVTLTVPNTLPVGFQVSVTQAGAGQVTFTGGTGMTINNRYSATKTSGQWAKAGLEIRAAGSAVLSGDVQ